jgi:hypothetical protein
MIACQDSQKTGAECMARSLRSPAVLMMVYVSVFVFAGPWLTTGPGAHRNLPELLIAVVLAMLAAHGSRAARVLMITYSCVGVFIVIFGSAYGSLATSSRLAYMAGCMLEIALLASGPMYQRTRPEWAPGQSQLTPWLPAPRIWALLVSVGAGLGITLLHIGNLRPIPCPAHVKVLAHTPCLAAGTGWPVAYHWFSGYSQLYDNGNDVRWLNVAAPSGLQVAAFATDWALWSLGILLVLYLTWLNFSRAYSDLPRQYGAEPSPAGP